MRISKLKVNGYGYGSTPVYLESTYDNIDIDDNLYTVFLGENGSGKSRILNSLALFFSKKSKNSVELGPDQRHPVRTIVMTHGIGDSYPLDRSYKECYKTLDYIYLGNKTRNGHYSKNSLLERSLRILFERSGDFSDHRELYNAVFDFIGYEPVIQVKYSVDKKIESLKNSPKYEDFKKTSELSSELFEDMLSKGQSLSATSILVTFDFNKKKSRINKECGLERAQVRELLKLGYLKATEIITKTKTNRNVSSEGMSSGEVGILSSFLSLIASIRSESLILIDEPEVSLHPAWQIQYFSLLKKIVDTVKGCHVMIATHSHLLVSDLHPDYSSIIIVKSDPSGDIQTQMLKYSPYSWSAENILFEVFSVNSSRNYYFAQHVQNALDLLAKHDRNEGELKAEIEIIKAHSFNLKESDPLYTIVNLLLKSYEG